jgi:hypothetical protein
MQERSAANRRFKEASKELGRFVRNVDRVLSREESGSIDESACAG